MDAVLSRHDAIVHAAVRQAGGEVYKHTGDGMGAAFGAPSAAIRAAWLAQIALQDEDWSAVGDLRVRMGIHVGEADKREGYYFGSCLNHVARLMGAAAGGQVLVSRAAKAMISELPSGASLANLGMHRLRDLSRADSIFGLVHPELPSGFPPIQSEKSGNLPAPATALVGRVAELEQLHSWLDESPLVTIRAFGGTGKTRLSIALARRVASEFPDGVWFLSLASVSDPALLAGELAALFDIGPSSLDGHLAHRRLLVVVNNCEHVLDAAASLVLRMLRAPGVRVIATTREALNLPGERVLPLEPLPMDASTELFLTRAQVAKPSFELTPHNASDVARIVQTVDGVPLALELAASRIRLLTPQQIADRLDQSLKLLKGGTRTALPHHRSLEAAIDWSYDMLDASEAELFCRLSLFHGGFTVEGATAVGGFDDEFDLLEGLAQLVDKSLVVAGSVEGESRYRMLEPLRQYCGVRIDPAVAAEARLQHALHYQAFAERGGSQLRGPKCLHWLACLNTEQDNLRAALAFGVEHRVDIAQRIAVALIWFWLPNRTEHEGREWFGKILASDPPPAVRAPALVQASFLYTVTPRRTAEALELVAEAKQIYTGLQDWPGLGQAMTYEAIVMWAGRDLDAAKAQLLGCLTAMQEAQFAWGIAFCSWFLGSIAWLQGDIDQARALYEPALESFKEIGDLILIPWTMLPLANIARDAGDRQAAHSLYSRALPLMNDIDDRLGVVATLIGAGITSEGDSGHSCILEAQEHLRVAGGGQGVAWALSNMPVNTVDYKDHLAITARYRDSVDLEPEAWLAMVLADVAAWRPR